MMTRTQKTAIPEMRTEAIAYGAIAEQPGMSLGSVMMFVSHHNRADDRRCERRWKRLSKGPGTAQISCSTKCKTLWWKANPMRAAEQVQRARAICGAAFSGSKGSKYCSRACYYASMHK